MISIEDIADALERKNYRHAARLLKTLQQESPRHPWLKFYIGRYYEETGKLEAAEKAYRLVLRQASQPKILGQARSALQRIEAIPQQRRKDEIARAKADPRLREPGILILEPIDPAVRKEAAQAFAKVMQIQAYSARLILPTRTWRFYRAGAIGELQILVRELARVGIDSFCVTLAQIQQVRVFRVSYIQSVSPQIVLVCQDESDRAGQLSLNWSEISAQVLGNLPIFKEVAVENHRKTRVTYKQKTHEYMGVYDWHIPGRSCIIRLCQDTYQFDRAIPLNPPSNSGSQPGKVMPNLDNLSTHLKWQNLLKFLQSHLGDVKSWSDFTPFAETAIDEADLLDRIPHYVDIFRFRPSVWDPAFHLYSTLAFIKAH